MERVAGEDGDGGPRLLVVVAHPDDETFGCGSLLLHAAAQGFSTAVVCATRGEAGDTTVTGTELGVTREAELRAAAAALGVSRVDVLDFRDSGMSGPVPPGGLVDAPVDDVMTEVRDRIDQIRPHVLVTLDASDGHRDHAAIRDATLAAAQAAWWQIDSVYLYCLPQSLMTRWVDHMARHDPSWEHLRGAVLGTPDDVITTVVDTGPHLEERQRAIAIHSSQRSPYDSLPEELRRAFLSTEHLRRVRPEWGGGPLESELFVGCAPGSDPTGAPGRLERLHGG